MEVVMIKPHFWRLEGQAKAEEKDGSDRKADESAESYGHAHS